MVIKLKNKRLYKYWLVSIVQLLVSIILTYVMLTIIKETIILL
ncbi:two-component sensor histidine kinase, partial [Clostridium botulinum]|nr:two-component sensor histidine kinase [Clostridium botulinum]